MDHFKAKEIVAKETSDTQLTEEWWDNPPLFKPNVTRLHIILFKMPYRLIATILCRLYVEKDPQLLKMEWIRLL